MTTTSDTLETLIRTAAGGDRQAQNTLLTQYWPIISRAVRGRKSRLGQALAAREQTQDLEQQAALRLLSSLARHRWQGTSAFAAWVRRIADGQVVDAYRHHRAAQRDAARDGEFTESGPAPRTIRSPESRVESHRRIETLVKDLDALKPDQATALMMNHAGFSHGEIGEVLDCTPEAARKLVSRARTKLVAKRMKRED